MAWGRVAVIVVVEVDVVDVLELAVTGSHKGEPEFKNKHKSCDLLRAGSNDFGEFFFYSRSSPPSINHMFVTASSLTTELNHNDHNDHNDQQ